MIRPSRVLAIARSDLAVELAGRQGYLLPAVIAGLLLPASLVPSPIQNFNARLSDTSVMVAGDVPPAVLQADGVVSDSIYKLSFKEEPDVLLLDGPIIPKGVRGALDERDVLKGRGPGIVLDDTPRGLYFPGRTALLSLIAASTLTGAVSQSIGGERQRKTLVVLLSASVTRTEIVFGKWVAWGGFGAGSALLGAAISILLGRSEPGIWLLALPTVPLATVALGLWLVRRAGDVMAGSATALRVLPATLSVAAVIAWLLGDSNPWLGALVPLGGALLTAGQTWPASGPTVLAAASTMTLAVGALAATIRDLEETPDRSPPEDRSLVALGVGALASMIWWMCIAGPFLWRMAGNPKITPLLPPAEGVFAGAAALALFSLVRATRSHRPVQEELSLRLVAPASAVLVAVLALGGLLGASLLCSALSAHDLGVFGSDEVRERFTQALHPRWAGLATASLVIVADELLFRGWLQKAVGPGLAIAVWTLVKTPLDPLQGLLSGLVCTGAARVSGSIWASLAARMALLFLFAS